MNSKDDTTTRLPSNLLIPAIIYFILTHILICCWVSYDALKRGINHIRWFKFCLLLPVLGALIYGLLKRTWKVWVLMFNFWIVVPGIVLLVMFIIQRVQSHSG